MKDNGLATALFVLIIGGAVASAIAGDVAAPLCRAAQIKSMAPDKIEFGCLEFWLNRYQSLIGNLATAAVAGITLYWIAGQLKTADRQAAAAAAAALRTYASELESEIEGVAEGVGAVFREWSKLSDAVAGYSNPDDAVAMAHQLRSPLENSIGKLINGLAADRNKSFPQVIQAELDSFFHEVVQLRIIYSGFNELSYGAYTLRSNPGRGLSEESWRTFLESQYTAGKSYFKRLIDARNGLLISSEKYQNRLSNEMREVWRQIRDFEQAAITGLSR